MTMSRTAAVVGAMALLVGAMSSCTSDQPAGSSKASPARAAVSKPFTSSGFTVTVTGVKVGQKVLPASARHRITAKSSPRPTKGQFVLVFVTVKNDSTRSLTFTTSRSTITADDGRRYGVGPYPLTGVQDLGFQPQPPGATVSGYLPFDVPPNVRSIRSVDVLPLTRGGSTTTVSVG